MFDRWIWSALTQDIAIDLGTANTLVTVGDLGVVINEPSVVAINTASKQVLAVGAQAKEMIGRTPAHVVATRPLQDGVISDFDAAEAMIRYFVQKVFSDYGGVLQINRPRVVIGVPSIITEVEARAVIDAAKSAGARKVYIIEEPVAAAIGVGLDIADARGRMVIDVGGGTTDIAIISLGGMVVDKTIKVAGDEFDKTVADYIKSKYNLQIGLRQAEQLKKEVGSLISLKKELKSEVSGRDMITNLPNTLVISSVEVREALLITARKIVDAVREALEVAPPELLSDILQDGIYLVGGGANLRGFDQFIAEAVKVPVKVMESPEHAVVLGTKKLLLNMDLLDQVQLKDYAFE